MKKFLPIIFGFYIFSSYAEELKLLCDLEIKKTYRSGTVENEKHIATVEIYSSKTLLSMIVTGSEPLIAVSTKLSPNVINVKNDSDSNRWEVTVIRKDEERGEQNTQKTIQIDRNTGYLNYQSNFRNGGIYTSGAGYCKKVDITTRKF